MKKVTDCYGLTKAEVMERVNAVDPLNSMYPDMIETDVAKLLAFYVLQGCFVYCLETSTWYYYNGDLGIYEADRGDCQANLCTMDFVDCLLAYAEEHGTETYIRWAKSLTDGVRRRSLLKTAKDLVGVHKEDFDSDPVLINFEDCVLNLETLEKFPHSPDYLMTKVCHAHIAVNVPKKRATLTAFPPPLRTEYDNFMGYAFWEDRETIDYINAVLGYCLLEDNPEKKFFLLQGPPNTGKSVLANVALTIMGEYSATVDFSTLQKGKKTGGAPRADLMALKGLHCAVVPEPDKDFIIDPQFIKSATGRDQTSSRSPYGIENETFRIGAKILIMCNQLPIIYDPAIFDSGRVCLFQMDHVATNKDKKLETKLLTEESKSYIVAKWIEGLQRYRENPSTIEQYPKSIQEAIEEYKQNSDRIACFWKDCAVAVDGAITKGQDAHDVYIDWCNRNEFKHHLGQNIFYAEMRQRGYMEERKRMNGKQYWNVIVGYRLRNQEGEMPI